MRLQRKMAGLTEDGSYGPPAGPAIVGSSVFSPSNSRVDGPNASGYYSSGHGTGLTQPGTQPPSPHPLPSPDPDVAAADRLQQALDVCREALRLRKPLYRAAVQFCCDQVEFAVDLGVNGWVAPEDTFVGGANAYATLRDALADTGELDLAQTAEVAAQLASALAALRGEEASERTVAKRPALFEQAIFEATAIKELPDGKLRVRGIVQRAGVRNRNSRVYPHALMKREVSALQQRLKNGEIVYAGLDHPAPDGIARLSNAAAVWKTLSMSEDGVVSGEAELLDTPAGKTAAAILKSTGKIAASSRGYGTTTAGENNEQLVSDDYKLVSFDFVDGGSTPGAEVSLA